jgi:hypothetical protein
MEAIDIRHFKLTNGEDLICYVQSTNEHAFIVERPAAVRVSPAGIWTFADWFPFSEKKVFKIMKRFVINHTEVVDETKESYIKYSCQDMIKKVRETVESFEEYGDEINIDEAFEFDAEENKTIH